MTKIPDIEPTPKAAAVFDFASLDTSAAAEQGSELHLEHPATGEPIGASITLAGADSALYQKAQAAINNRRLNARRKKVSIEDLTEEGIELLGRCTLSWSGIRVDGAVLTCSLENAKRFYARFPWVREQVEHFINDRTNYLQD